VVEGAGWSEPGRKDVIRKKRGCKLSKKSKKRQRWKTFEREIRLLSLSNLSKKKGYGLMV